MYFFFFILRRQIKTTNSILFVQRSKFINRLCRCSKVPDILKLWSPRRKRKTPQRSLIWLMCSYSSGEPNTPSFESVQKENVSWTDRFFVFFSLSPVFTLPMERSEPMENNKVRNLTSTKAMRTRKHLLPHRCIVEERMDEEREWKTQCVRVAFCLFCFLGGGGGVSICVRAFMCVRQMGSCSGGAIVPAHCANIDRQQVSRSKKEGRNQKGTLAFVRVSLQHKAMTVKHDESVTRWKPKIKPFFKLTVMPLNPGFRCWTKLSFFNHKHTHTHFLLKSHNYPTSLSCPWVRVKHYAPKCLQLPVANDAHVTNENYSEPSVNFLVSLYPLHFIIFKNRLHGEKMHCRWLLCVLWL